MQNRPQDASKDAPNRDPLSTYQLGIIMARSGASIRTIRAWWNGGKMSALTTGALERAARSLHIKVPDRPQELTTIATTKTRAKRESQRPETGAEG